MLNLHLVRQVLMMPVTGCHQILFAAWHLVHCQPETCQLCIDYSFVKLKYIYHSHCLVGILHYINKYLTHT